jgi:hypothetical protein
MRQIESLNRDRLARDFINLNYGSADSRLTFRMLRSFADDGSEARDYIGFFHADDPGVTASHT